MTLTDMRYKLEQWKGERRQLLMQRSETELEIGGLRRSIHRHEQAKAILREVSILTQKKLQFHISTIASLALDAVLQHDSYELKVEFVQRRNKTECDIFFERAGNRLDPMTASGGGAVDVAAFALRIASWSMRNNKTRPVIILDEPFRFLSSDYQPLASLMIKELSVKLGIQFIIVTHEKELTAHADKVFQVHIQNKKSKVI